MKRKIILIGGMPTAGKTTVSRQVAKHFDLPLISTDQIRIIMQSVASKSKHPLLFSTDGQTAEKFLTTYSAAEIAEMEYNQGNEVWIGIKHFIETDWTWRNGCVIEGVSILPSLVHELDTETRDLRVVFLSDNDHSRIEHVVYNRGLFDDASLYSDDLKEKEVEWLKIFDKKLRADAAKYGHSVLNVKKDESDILHVLEALNYNKT